MLANLRIHSDKEMRWMNKRCGCIAERFIVSMIAAVGEAHHIVVGQWLLYLRAPFEDLNCVKEVGIDIERGVAKVVPAGTAARSCGNVEPCANPS